VGVHNPLASGAEPSEHDPPGGVGGFGFCGHFVVVGSHGWGFGGLIGGCGEHCVVVESHGTFLKL